MRILLFSHARKDPDGGASRVYHLLEEGLSARGHSVRALHYDDLAIPRRAEKVVSRLFFPQVASRRISRQPLADFDVIMTSSGMLHPLFRRLKPLKNRPLLVSHLHGLSLFDHQAKMNEVLRGNMSVSRLYTLITGPLPIRYDENGSRFADLTIVQNGRDLEFLREKGFDPVVTIPLCVHGEILAAGVSAASPEIRPPATLLWFGSWVERKGNHYMPEAFRQIVELHPASTLTLGGTGFPEKALKEQFDPELRERITVLPRISRAQQIDIFQKHAIFVFPSLSEGFGFALLEAMSLGLAAVTTHAGLAADYLTDRENAIIVPPASASQLARGVSRLIQDPSLRCRIATNGQRLSRQFTAENLVRAYEETFEHFRLIRLAGKGTDHRPGPGTPIA